MQKNVLVVTSDMGFWESMHSFFSERGYDLRITSDFARANEVAESGDLDLLVADIDMNSRAELGLLLETARLRDNIKTAFVCANQNEELLKEAHTWGVGTILTKPLILEDLCRVVGLDPGSGDAECSEIAKIHPNIEQSLLWGFSSDLKWDFRLLGMVRSLAPEEIIDLDEEECSMVWVESGNLQVYMNSTLVDQLAEGDFWGEESFVNPGSVNTHLIARDAVKVRQFQRRKILDFFAYNDETLTKRYIINLVICLHRRCKRALARLAALNLKTKEEA